MKRRNAKIALISFLLVILVISGFYGWKQIEQNQEYSMNHLVQKYPTFLELKLDVDSGQLDYDKLPDNVKEMYDNYQPFDEITEGEDGYIALDEQK